MRVGANLIDNTSEGLMLFLAKEAKQTQSQNEQQEGFNHLEYGNQCQY